MIYLTGAFRRDQAPELVKMGIGVMLQPKSHYERHVERLGFPCWAADNGCFAQGEQFSAPKFYTWLDRVPRSRLLFVVAPDVYGDHAATRRRSAAYLWHLGCLGFPRAFVAQNGATWSNVPWKDFEWLFLGGSDIWKLGREARDLVREARNRNRRVHMGRVNSAKRLQYAATIGCHSADGTYLAFRNRTATGIRDMHRLVRQGILSGLHG